MPISQLPLHAKNFPLQSKWMVQSVAPYLENCISVRAKIAQWRDYHSTKQCKEFKWILNEIHIDAIKMMSTHRTSVFAMRSFSFFEWSLVIGLCLMHSKLLHMFENLSNTYLSVDKDHLFQLVVFTISAHICKTEAMMHGMLCKNSLGASWCLIHEVLINKQAVGQWRQ